MPALPYDTRITEVEAQIPLKGLGGALLTADTIVDSDDAGGGGDELGGDGVETTEPGGNSTSSSTNTNSTGSLFPGMLCCVLWSFGRCELVCIVLMHAFTEQCLLQRM